MASIQKLDTGYKAQVYVSGVRKSARFRTKREAEAWAAATETELRDQADKPVADKTTLRQLLTKYKEEVTPTKRGKRWEEIRIDAFLRDKNLPVELPLSKISSVEIGLWRDSRLRVISPSSVLRELTLLSAAFEEGRREWKLIDQNPVRDVRKPRGPDHREVVITRQQIKAMLREMGYSPRLPVRTVACAVAVTFLTALRTGMRAGELCGLTWDRVFDGYCSLPVTKTVPRDVPLTKKAMRLINQMKGFDSNLVFGLKTSSLDAMFRKYRDRAGLSGFTFHDSRHTAATWIAAKMKSNGLPAQQALLDLCKMFGWSRMDQALTYYNPKASDIAKRIG